MMSRRVLCEIGKLRSPLTRERLCKCVGTKKPYTYCSKYSYPLQHVYSCMCCASVQCMGIPLEDYENTMYVQKDQSYGDTMHIQRRGPILWTLHVASLYLCTVSSEFM